MHIGAYDLLRQATQEGTYDNSKRNQWDIVGKGFYGTDSLWKRIGVCETRGFKLNPSKAWILLNTRAPHFLCQRNLRAGWLAWLQSLRGEYVEGIHDSARLLPGAQSSLTMRRRTLLKVIILGNIWCFASYSLIGSDCCCIRYVMFWFQLGFLNCETSNNIAWLLALLFQ